jgi:type IX secretion system substrate protein
MNKLLVVLATLCLISSFGFAQTWTYDSDVWSGSQPHGVAIDGNGLMWIGAYAYTDTIFVAPSDTFLLKPIYVFNPDGSPAAFSPIRFLTYGGVLDTIDDGCRGLTVDHNGDIIWTGYTSVYRINHLTGEAMDRYDWPYGGGSLTKPGIDANGYLYFTRVVPGGTPIVILDDDMDEYGYVIDSCFTIQRSGAVSADGNDFFLPIIYASGGNNGVIRYHSDNGPDGPYAVVDTLYRGTIWGQSINWDNNGLLWVGSYWNCNFNDWGGWYALDPTQDFAIVDTIYHHFGNSGPLPDPIVTPGGTIWAPRHVAWTPDGLTMITADFDGGVVKKWTNAAPLTTGATPIWTNPLSVDFNDENSTIAVEFSLDQNYPNPFNPSTKIPFDIKKKFNVKLVIFDMLGRPIATLVDDELAPKHYEFTFDGSNFSSGTYFYQLIVDGAATTKQMMLIK